MHTCILQFVVKVSTVTNCQMVSFRSPNFMFILILFWNFSSSSDDIFAPPDDMFALILCESFRFSGNKYRLYLSLIFLKMSTSFVFPGVEFNQRRKQFSEGKVFQQKTLQQLTREFQMWTHINSKHKSWKYKYKYKN